MLPADDVFTVQLFWISFLAPQFRIIHASFVLLCSKAPEQLLTIFFSSLFLFPLILFNLFYLEIFYLPSLAPVFICAYYFGAYMYYSNTFRGIIVLKAFLSHIMTHNSCADVFTVHG